MSPGRIEAIDRNQLELRLAYELEPERRQQRYQVDLWLFLPVDLGLSRESIPPEVFFAETSTFVRIKTPRVGLESLSKKKGFAQHHEPLKDVLDGLLSGREQDPEPAIKGLKLMGRIFRSTVRDEVAHLQASVERLRALGALDGEKGQGDVGRRIEGFRESLEGVLARMRQLGARCEGAAMPEEVRSTWYAVDEYTAFVAEEACTGLIGAIDRLPGQSAAEGSRSAVRESLALSAIEAHSYRESRGYPSVVAGGGDGGGEALPYRRRLLKRIVTGVLDLDAVHRRPGGLLADLIGMVMAAVAMLFAAVTAIWAGTLWDGFDGAFVSALVVSYVIKDRIKEWGKRYLGHWILRGQPTRILDLRASEGHQLVGRLRETFAVCGPEDLGGDVRALRHADHPGSVAEAGRPEIVFHYTKHTSLSSAALRRQLPGATALNDIMRLNVSRFRDRMEDPIEMSVHVDPVTRALVETPCSRVYHLNLVLRISGGTGEKRTVTTTKTRVVMDQTSIRRVETSDPAGVERTADPLTG